MEVTKKQKQAQEAAVEVAFTSWHFHHNTHIKAITS
jgi:hypothetical protein